MMTGSRVAHLHRLRQAGRALCLCAAVACGSAQAALGEPVASIHTDQMRLQGRRVQESVWAAQVHVIELADGSRVRQYVNAEGRVFALSWHSRLKPDLAALLGHHQSALAGMQAARPGLLAARQGAQWTAPDLVLGQSGRGSTHAGWAYVPSLTPRGFDVARLR